MQAQYRVGLPSTPACRCRYPYRARGRCQDGGGRQGELGHRRLGTQGRMHRLSRRHASVAERQRRGYEGWVIHPCILPQKQQAASRLHPEHERRRVREACEVRWQFCERFE